MPNPDYQTIMLPLLKLAADGQEHSIGDAVNQLAKHFNLTDEECKELLPSGNNAKFNNRVGWARTHLKKAQLIDSQKRGYFNITERGKQVLSNNPGRIDNNYLQQFSEFVEFRSTKKKPKESADPITTNDGADALGPDNKLIFAPGPFSGTTIPWSCNLIRP